MYECLLVLGALVKQDRQFEMSSWAWGVQGVFSPLFSSSPSPSAHTMYWSTAALQSNTNANGGHKYAILKEALKF